jgi:molecular chaperone DnaK (HSP70)
MKVTLGLDFGCGNCCLSYYNEINSKVTVIQNEQGHYTTPTILFLNKESSEILYGENALYLLQSNNNIEYLSNIFSNLKRLIGKNKQFLLNNEYLLKTFQSQLDILSDNESGYLVFNIMYNNKQQEFTIPALICIFLNYIKQLAINKFSSNNTEFDLVVTAPVYFDDIQRNILKECCEHVGFNVIRIITEPVSAGLAYGIGISKEINKTKDGEYILVFDAGTSTLDLTLINMDYTDDIYQVENSIGDNFLGGEDITNLLMEYIIKKTKLNKSELSKRNLNKIKQECEKIKKQLSFNTTANFCVESLEINLNLSQVQFNYIIEPFCKKIKDLVYFLINEMISNNPTFTYNHIENIIFIGGCSRIPYFKTLFKQIFHSEYLIINDTIDPDQTVSIGATYQGSIINGLLDDKEPDILLLDVVSLSLGVETKGGIMIPIVSRNTTLPVTRSRTFTNEISFENTININIYQGERKFVKDNFFLGSFDLICEEFTKFSKEDLIINVTFEINCNNIITIKAECKFPNSGEEERDLEPIKIVKQISIDNVNVNLHEIIFSAEMNKLLDSEASDKILKKLELYDSFKYLLSIFHEKRSIILENSGCVDENGSFLLYQLNKLFENTFNTITNFEKYTAIELKNSKENFEKQWHELLFDVIIFKDSNGLIVEFGSTVIKDNIEEN